MLTLSSVPLLFFFLLGIFLVYIFNAIPKVPHTHPPIPYPPTPPFWPCRSPVLGHIKFTSPMGLSLQWWPTRPSFDTYAAKDKSSLFYNVLWALEESGRLIYPCYLGLRFQNPLSHHMDNNVKLLCPMATSAQIYRWNYIERRVTIWSLSKTITTGSS
jgi:hypothetical protein